MERSSLRSVAHDLMRAEIGAIGVSRLCPRCGSSGHGRPSVRVTSGEAPSVSVSYAGDLVAVAWGWSGPVGIDVEEDGPAVDGVDRRAFSRSEALFKAARDVPTAILDVPAGYVGTVAGSKVTWRLAGPGASSPPATRR